MVLGKKTGIEPEEAAGLVADDVEAAVTLVYW